MDGFCEKAKQKKEITKKLILINIFSSLSMILLKNVSKTIQEGINF